MERTTVYDPTRDAWLGLPGLPHEIRQFATQVWAGDRLLVWGGFEGESFLRPTGGDAFVPAARYAYATPPELGERLRVEVVDASGSLVGVRRPSELEVASIDRPFPGSDEPVLVTNLDERTIFVEWSGGPGDLAARIEITPDGRTIDLVAVPTYGDAMAVGHAIALVFDRPVDAGSLDLRFWDGRR